MGGEEMAFIGHNRRNGFWCPLLTRKNNCRQEKKPCVGIEIKNSKVNAETHYRIEKCKEKLLKLYDLEIALVIREEEKIREVN